MQRELWGLQPWQVRLPLPGGHQWEAGVDRPQHSVRCKCQRTAPVGAWGVPQQMTRPRRARWMAKVIDGPHFLPVGQGERQEGGGKSV